MTPFALALKFTLFAEGGYSDNPADSGGPTNYGITQGSWDAYTAAQGLAPSPVSGLPLSTAKAIYQHAYWDAGHCQALPEKLGICHFDWCVNHGVGGAAFTLQEALGVTQDGDIGPATLAAAAVGSVEPKVSRYLALRRAWYKQDVANNQSQSVFLDGWMNRVNNLQAYLAGLHG
jgi:lysozyme family protein